jgi:hypothetical protein
MLLGRAFCWLAKEQPVQYVAVILQHPNLHPLSLNLGLFTDSSPVGLRLLLDYVASLGSSFARWVSGP